MNKVSGEQRANSNGPHLGKFVGRISSSHLSRRQEAAGENEPVQISVFPQEENTYCCFYLEYAIDNVYFH